jgi:hypothetical protein
MQIAFFNRLFSETSKSRSGDDRTANAPKDCATCYATMLASSLRERRANRFLNAGGALELNNRRLLLYRKPTHLLATLFAVELSQPLKVVVEHSRMTDQTHLFRRLDVARPDHSATPRADNVKCRLEAFKFFVALRIYVSAHA